jgi:hypothetical protein
VAIDGGASVVVQEQHFAIGPYVNGDWASTDPVTCFVVETGDNFPAWTGNRAEFESEVNLSAAPFNLAPGSTLSIRLRMLVDDLFAGNGWDVNWVRVTASSP